MILAAEDAVSLTTVSLEIFRTFMKCPGEISGYEQVLGSSVRLNANFGWTVLELLINGFSFNSSSPSLREETVFQPFTWTFM